MKHISLFKTKKDYEIEELKMKLEHSEQAYMRAAYENTAWSNAILKAAMSRKISYEAQKLLYDLHNDEMTSIYKRLL